MRFRLAALSLTTAFHLCWGQTSSDTRPRAESIAGNGVDTATGEFHWSELPLPFSLPGSHNVGLSYASGKAADQSGDVGFGWAHPFEYWLSPVSPLPGTIVTVVALDKTLRFRYRGADQACEPLDLSTRFDSLVRSSGTWYWTQSNGVQIRFDPTTGLMASRSDLGGRNANVLRDSVGQITSVSELGPTVFFTYANTDGRRRLTTISDEASRVAQLLYDSDGRLTALRGPAFMDERYNTGARSVAVNTSPRVLASLQVSRNSPAGLVRLSGTLRRTQTASGTRPSGTIRMQLRSPAGRTVEVAGINTRGRSGTSETLLFTASVGFFDEWYGTSPQGTWQVLGSIASGSGAFVLDANLRFSDVMDQTTFVYSGGRLASAIGPDDLTTFVTQYDAENRVTSQDDGVPGNQIATFRYAPAPGGGVTTVYRDRLGHEWTYVHDSQLNLLARTDPLKNQLRFAYNFDGLRTSATDANGNVTEFGYDAFGRLTNIYQRSETGVRVLRLSASYGTSPTARVPLTLTDSLGHKSSFSANQFNSINFTRVTDAEGAEDTRQWTGSGSLSRVKLADGGELEFRYTGAGFLSSTRHPEDSGSSIGAKYDEIGRLVSRVEADGAENSYTYDARLQPLESKDTAGTVSRRYDLRGRLISETDRDQNTTAYAYDGNSNRTTVVDASGSQTFAYDGEDRLVAETDGAGHTRRYEYDAAGRLIAVTDSEGSVTRTEYDAVGNVVAERDGEGKLLSRVIYDYRNQPVMTIDALGRETTYTYNDAGRLEAVRDPLGRETRRIYDRVGRLVEVRDPLGRRSTQKWTTDDRIESLSDHRAAGANEPLVSFAYDRSNRLTRVTTGAGQSRFTYTKADQVSRQTSAAGRRQDYTYDDKGNLTGVKSTWTGQPSADIANEFDPSGNLVRTTATLAGRRLGAIARTFDNRNRLASYTDADGNALRYFYDEAGNVSRLVYPDGKTLRYAYDKRGRITAVTDWANRVTTLAWDLDGGVSKIVFPNGTVRTMDYDRSGRLTRRVDRNPQGGVIVDYRYHYDAGGQLRAESNGGGLPPNLANLTEARMTYNRDNVLTSFNGTSVTADADGNVTGGPLNQGFANFVYDARNNLVSAGSTTYRYDAEDRLIAYTQGSAETRFIVNPAPKLSQIVAKIDARGAQTRYVWAVGLLYEETPSGIRVYHYDQHGNTVAFSDAAGRVVGQVTYSPYGKILGRTGDTDSPFLYCGLFGVVTDANELAYMRYRWYSPVTRRFLNADAHFGTIQDPQSLNRFSYAGNSPVLRTDPDGQFWHILAGAVIGAVAAVVVQGVSDLAQGKFSGFERYGAVAIGGAVAGGITAACGGLACAGLAGAVNSALTSLTESAFRGEAVDFGQLAQDTAIGAVGGLAGGVAGKKLGTAYAKFTGTPPGTHTLKTAFSLTARDLPRAYARIVVRRTVASEFGLSLLGKSAGLAGRLAYGALLGSAQAANDETPRINARAKYAIEGVSRQEINQGHIGVYGEHEHWSLFLQSLRLAGLRPLVNQNNVLAVF